MKKFVIAISVVMICFIFASCGKDAGEDLVSNGTYDGKTESFSDAAEAFESMSEAIEAGDFQAALDCYQNGAADAEELNLNSMYFYSLAMNEYDANGCVGYPLDILFNRTGDLYGPAKETYEKLLALVSPLNGVYSLDSTYIYISDGKIAVSEGGRLSELYFCDSEIAVNDGVFSWVKRTADGTHEVKYTIEVVENGIVLKAAKDSTDTVYEGEYKTVSAEMPELCY